MNLQVSFKHMESSDALREYVEEKASKFKKYFDGKVHVTWTVGKEHGEFTSHCHLLGNHIDFFGEGSATDAFASVDLAIDKIDRKLKKHKEVVTNHKS